MEGVYEAPLTASSVLEAFVNYSRHVLPTALVIIPTYNERESLERLLPRVLATGVDVLIVDDSSPDGSGAFVAEIAASQPRLSLLKRASKQGLGRAYIAGFRYALERGYDVIIEMDADGSHPVSSIPEMLGIVRDRPGVAGVVGSRWVPGGSVVNWPKLRELISRAGSAYARALLQLPIRDVTSGFRAYRADTLRAVDLDSVASQGYCFQIDMTRRILGTGKILVEVPIEFRDREFGESKMSGAIVWEAMLRTTGWGIARLFRR